jgi:hypothetical protein
VLKIHCNEILRKKYKEEVIMMMRIYKFKPKPMKGQIEKIMGTGHAPLLYNSMFEQPKVCLQKTQDHVELYQASNRTCT